ncbi:MAG: hypothetical protein R6V58_15365 [Planctomycetota bacterium]
MMRLGQRDRRRRGSAVIVAIAVIVIVGFLGSAMVAAVRVGAGATVGRVQGAQANLLADAGIEWACVQETGTAGPMELGGGTFEVAADGDEWVATSTAGDATRQARCEPAPAEEELTEGTTYVDGSRDGLVGWIVTFRLVNTSDEDVEFNRVKVTWDSPTAYFEALSVRVFEYQWYGLLWSYLLDPGQPRFGSGETRQLNVWSSVTIPAHHTARFSLSMFREGQDPGEGGDLVDMNGTELTVDLLQNSVPVGQVEVGLPPEP